MRTIFFTFVYLVCLQARGQELVFSEPVKLGSQINSEDEELAPLLSSDGKTLYFSRAFHTKNTGGKFAGTDVWVSKKDGQGNWLPASNAGSPWNNKQSNAVIGINHDHTVVYLLNTYSNKSGIAFSKLFSGAWGAPEFIPISGINRDDFVGFYVSPAFDVILISMKGKDSYGEEDLYVSLKDSFGKWTEPKNLGTTINTKGFEISPFLSPDKKRLFFSSSGHPGFGDADIFYCDRLFDSWETWSVPKNLGKIVNSQSFDGYFTFYDSGAFLSSKRIENKSEVYYLGIFKKDKSLMKDSVGKLVAETKQILNDLKLSKQETMALEFIEYAPDAYTVPKEGKDKILTFVKKYDPLRKGDYEILLYIGDTVSENRQKIEVDRSKNLVQYLVSIGINPDKIATLVVKEKSTKNGAQIRLYWTASD